jgi:hypothetical protein
MLNGIMLLWFVLTGLSVLFVAVIPNRTAEAACTNRGTFSLTQPLIQATRIKTRKRTRRSA